MSHVAVIDYGMGNLHSVAKALQHVAPPSLSVEVTQDPDVIESAQRVVFPGQGAIGDCMNALETLKLISVIKKAAAEKPFMGICLGPQALMSHSEENGGCDGLDIIPGKVKKFPTSFHRQSLKIPHMGWNRVRQNEHPLWDGISQDSWFYFVHSYYMEPQDSAITAGTSHYGFDFTAVIARNGIFATQFHPEKSADAGLHLLANFLQWNPDPSELNKNSLS